MDGIVSVSHVAPILRLHQAGTVKGGELYAYHRPVMLGFPVVHGCRILREIL